MEPSYRKEKAPDSIKCATFKNKNSTAEVHPYIQILTRQCLQEIQSPYVYFFHVNSIASDEKRRFEIELLKNDIHFRQYKMEVIEHALFNTRFAKLYNLLIHHGAFAFAESNKLAFLNRVLKKNSKVLLLGGLFENRILNKEQLNEYCSGVTLDSVRAQLCHTLSTPSIGLHSNLNYHLTDLSTNLQVHADKQSK